ncbi:MAG TPA: FkbM family methyltransferase [Gemmatimonadaceae bacterium]|nr:FkbM family methyltransferase [Gemmatimonadaceae bacterium]
MIVQSLRGAIKHATLQLGAYRLARTLERIVSDRKRAAHADAIELYRSLLPAGALCFDVGANIGEVSEAMLTAGARVVAFEPNPAVWPELLARCAHHPGFAWIPAGAGSASGLVTLFARDSHGQTSMRADWEGGDPHARDTTVPMVTLDAAIAKYGAPYYCKIDVEGWELEVLKGLTHRVPLISIESHTTDEYLADTHACLAHLARVGGAEINVAAGETRRMVFPEWMPLDQFLTDYPTTLRCGLSDAPYGDLFVRFTER